jgi:hypothetical protein
MTPKIWMKRFGKLETWDLRGKNCLYHPGNMCLPFWGVAIMIHGVVFREKNEQCNWRMMDVSFEPGS